MSRPELVAPPEIVRCRFPISNELPFKFTFDVVQYYGDIEAKKYTNKCVHPPRPLRQTPMIATQLAHTTDPGGHDLPSTRAPQSPSGRTRFPP